MFEDLNGILDRLISFPLRKQIKVDFDLNKKNFRLSIPIFNSHNPLPEAVKKYVEARKSHTFKPHVTTYQLEGDKKVQLIQEIPFSWGFQPTLRGQVDAFLTLAKQCHRVLAEMALEEKYEAALYLDTDFVE
jgi:hypothetical protein